MSTKSSEIQSEILQDLKVFRKHKKAFRQKMDEVLADLGESRHMAAIPLNPSAQKQVLSDSEKSSRLDEVNAKAKNGYYFDGRIFQDIADKMLSKLWNINVD